MGNLFAVRRNSKGGAGDQPLPVLADPNGCLLPATAVQTTTVTIGAGASLSGAADLLGLGQLVGLITASTWDAATITFAVSVDGANYFPLRFGGVEYSEANPGASQYVALDPAVFAGIRYIKIRSGVSTAATNQVDATVVTLVARPV